MDLQEQRQQRVESQAGRQGSQLITERNGRQADDKDPRARTPVALLVSTLIIHNKSPDPGSLPRPSCQGGLGVF